MPFVSWKNLENSQPGNSRGLQCAVSARRPPRQPFPERMSSSQILVYRGESQNRSNLFEKFSTEKLELDA